MFVSRACAKRWRGPPSVLFAGPRIATSVTTMSQTTTARAATVATAAARSSRPYQQHPLRSLATAAAPSGIPQVPHSSAEESQLQVLDEDDDAQSSALSAASKSRLDAIVKRRLHYLQDPYTIGKAVEDTLGSGKYEEALHLTRMASKNHQVVVSWNHLIGYLMRKEKLASAIKLYNEMKKRAQLPNAQTYTVIFRGCAQSPHASLAVYQATRLYYAMLDSERIKPNTIHMNAVLQVCARAKDIESLFSVAKTANLRSRMPDNMTYTTVLNGLRYSTALPHHRPVKEGGDEVHVDKEKVSVSIARARAVWEEVVTNWRQGHIVVDEELVCSMGRVLLMGNNHDNDDILSLVEQAMGIPRLDRQPLLAVGTPKMASNASAAQPAVLDKETETTTAEPGAEPTSQTDSRVAAAPIAVKAKPAAPPPARVTQFAPLPEGVIGSRSRNIDSGDGDGRGGRRSTGGGRGKSITYAHPSRNVLSLILTSIGATKKTTLATQYWDVLTSPPHSVVPDSENWYRLLRALRRGHASTKMAELMQKMPPALMNEKTFQLAMATCAADNLNDHVFASAGKVLDLMSRTLREPDPYTMRMYLQTAMTNNRRFRSETNPAAREAAKFAFGRQLVRALSRLWDPLRLASNTLTYPGRAFASAEEKQAQTYNARREIMALARQMVSAADMVVTEGMADEATTKDVRISRNLLNRQITRFYENREEMEPNLKMGRDRRDGGGRGGGGGGGGGREDGVRRPARVQQRPRGRQVSGRTDRRSE